MSKTPATRTTSEASRQQQLTLSKNKGMREAWTSNNSMLTTLDLTCLPIETIFNVAYFEEDNGALVINDNSIEVEQTLKLRSTEGTLRQSKWGAHGYQGHQWLGLEMNLTTATGNKFALRLMPDGRPGALNALDIAYRATSTIDCAAAVKQTVEGLDKMAFIPQHLIRFQATYYGREAVTFMGLPQGATIPLKNGGIFEVNCRTNVVVESDGFATGHLHLIAMDDKAKKLADTMGWGKQTLLGKDGYLVHPNLYTGLTGGRSFDIANIKLPYRDPTDLYRLVFPTPAVLKYGLHQRPTPTKMKGVWATTEEQMADALEDFLFG